MNRKLLLAGLIVLFAVALLVVGSFVINSLFYCRFHYCEDYGSNLLRGGTKYNIDGIWNSSSTLIIELRNSGKISIPQADFGKTTIYIDRKLEHFGEAGRTCTYFPAALMERGGNFSVGSTINITCADSYPPPINNSFANVSVRILPPYGTGALANYKYVP